MKIRVKEIVENLDKGEMVIFESPIGSAIANWKNRNQPIKNFEYDVELDINDKIILGKTAKVSDEQIYSISMDEETVILNGIVDDIDSDGMVYFRISLDCIIMIESVDSQLHKGMWLLLEFETSNIDIYAQGV